MTEFPGLEFINFMDLPVGDWQPDLISNTVNAIGNQPKNIMYLWLFNRHDSLCCQLVSHGWVFIGPVHLLVSPGARIDTPILKSKQAIDQTANKFEYEAGSYRCPKLIDYEYRPSYTGYPINCLWCSNTFWVDGFKRVFKCSDYFVADLSADERPDGLITEISYLFQSAPLEKVAFLMDTGTADHYLVSDLIQQAWNSMSPACENACRTKAIPVITYNTRSVRYLLQINMSIWSGKSKVPMAQKITQYLNW
jgi:hypothetical protein